MSKINKKNFYSDIVEGAESVIYRINNRGKFTYVNPYFVKFSGFQEKELLSRSLYEMVHADYSDYIKDHYNNQINNKFKQTFVDLPIITNAGKTKWIGQNVSLLLDENTVVGLQGIGSDVTLRKIVEQETQMLAKILEQTSEMIMITDKNGIIQYVNTAFEKITQHSKYEIIGKTGEILGTDKESQKYINEAWEQVLKGKSWQGIIKNRKKDGSVYDEELSINPVYDEFGNLINVVEIKRDITEELKHQRAAIEVEQKYRRIFDNAVEGIYQSSVEGKIINANRAFLQLFGFQSLEELKSIDIASTLYSDPNDRLAFQTVIKRDGKVIDYELKVRTKDGREIIILENARTVKDLEGNILFYEGMIQDISRRKEAEDKIKKLNAEKDKLFSIISHDLRAPFNSILGFVDFLLDEKAEFSHAERNEFLIFIKQAAEQQLRLLNNLLDWSRLETGRVRFEQKPMDLRRTVESAIVSLLGNAKRKNIQLYSDITDEIIVNGDENLILQLLGNLLSNAIKFTPAGGKVWVDVVEIENRFVKIAVRDTGVGIPEEDFDKLFRIDSKFFTQGTAGEEGTGLGLTLCGEIVNKHGGTIAAESKLNQGTSFIFTLPSVRKSILVVDDNKGDRSLAMVYIQQLFPNLLILEASDGYEGMSLAMSHVPTLILADFAMPGMDGLRLIRELRNQSQTKDIPVIIITSYESKADATSLLTEGVKEVFIKPVNKDEIQKAIAHYIKGE